ncbi:MAG: hypothetical protein ACTSQF_15895, partial [Candidatus Heimdallarchaeaceae archaeon]
ASYYLINCYLARKENEEAEKYLEALQQYSSKLDSKPISVMTTLAKALVYSKKENSADRKEAKELLESVINEKDVDHKLAVTAILNLCELLIVELRESEDLELLDKLKSYVEKLHQEGTAELAYPLLVQSIWLQANISLLELDVGRARRLFKSAQVMAEAKEMFNLARRISNNHDILLGQLNLWEKFTMQLPTVAERMELTHIESVLNEMIKGRGIVFPEGEVEIEEPILVSIFSETGATLYLEQFDPELSTDILEKFWYSIITRVKEEVKTGSLERMIFQDYTCLVKKLESLSFFYVFAGQSYKGIKKLEEFSQLVYGTSLVWEELEELSKIALSSKFDLETVVASADRDQPLDYSSHFILNQYVDSVFLRKK